MKSIVKKPLGHIGCVHTLVSDLPRAGKDALMHADTVEWQIVMWFQALLDVIGIQHGHLTCPFQSFRAQRPYVGVSLDHDIKIPVKGLHFTDIFRVIIGPRECISLFNHLGNWQKRQKSVPYTDGATSRPATPMRCRACFVEIQLDDVKSEVPRFRDAHERIGIGTITVQESPLVVYYLGHGLDIPFEQSQCIGVREHKPGSVFRHQLLQVLEINTAFIVGTHGHGLKPAQRTRCRIGPVSCIGNQYPGSRFPPGIKIFSDHHDTCQFAVRS